MKCLWTNVTRFQSISVSTYFVRLPLFGCKPWHKFANSTQNRFTGHQNLIQHIHTCDCIKVNWNHSMQGCGYNICTQTAVQSYDSIMRSYYFYSHYPTPVHIIMRRHSVPTMLFQHHINYSKLFKLEFYLHHQTQISCHFTFRMVVTRCSSWTNTNIQLAKYRCNLLRFTHFRSFHHLSKIKCLLRVSIYRCIVKEKAVKLLNIYGIQFVQNDFN